MQDVSREQLRRFFFEADNGYRLNKSVREHCVFARQNLTSDPPFSRMDLISCRNLLIYLLPDVQNRILALFHFALRPGGVLFLGRAEATTGVNALFTPMDRRHKVFSKKVGSAHGDLHAFTPLYPSHKRPLVGFGAFAVAPGVEAQREAERLLLARFAPASVVVNADFDIVQFRGHTSHFLEPPAGRPTLNVLKMAREGLTSTLRTVLLRAKKHKAAASVKGVRLIHDGRTINFNIEVIPLKQSAHEQTFFLILFQTASPPPLAGPSSGSTKADGNSEPRESEPPVRPGRQDLKIKRELDDTRAHLNSIIEEQETYAEELQAAHEEAQASNEELQSINEELETSKEELQATNEELSTINSEMQARNSELTLANEDLANLLGSVRLPIVMVGIDLRIRRFNVAAGSVLSLIPTDIGRPIGNIRPPAEGEDLEALLSEVIREMTVKQREIQDRNGRWMLMRAHPYRTTENKIDGAILLLIDTDELKRTMASLDYSEAIINTLHEALIVLRPDFRVETANRAFYQMFELRPEDTIGKLIYDLNQGQWNFPVLHKLLEQTIPRNSAFSDVEVVQTFDRLGQRTLLLNARLFDVRGEEPRRILVAIEDISNRRKNEAALRASELRYRRLFESAKDGIVILNPRNRKIIDGNPYIVELLGHSGVESIVDKELWEVGLLSEKASGELLRELQRKATVRYDNVQLQAKDGQAREIEFICNRYQENNHVVIQCNIRDVTERRQMIKSLEQAGHFRRLMIDCVRDHAIFTLDINGRINSWNKGAERMFGYEDSEILGQPGDILFTPEDRKAKAPQKEMRSATESGYASDERWHLRKGGGRFLVSGEMTPILDEKGKLHGFTKVSRDVTELKEREAALAEQARLLDLTSDAVIVRDVNHSITYWNAGAESLYGWKRSEALGKNLHQLLKCEFPKPLESIMKDLYSQNRWNGEVIQTTKDGRRIIASSRWALDRDTSRRSACILETNTDISERKKAEESLGQARDQLRRHASELQRSVIERTAELTDANKQLEAFVYTIAHDLRAPLRSLQGFSSVLTAESSEGLDSRGRDFLRRINQSALHMDRLLTDLLAFSRISQQQIEIGPVNLEEAIDSALASLEAEIQQKQPLIERQGPWPTVRAHQPTLVQILVNLINNAIKFVPPGVKAVVRLRWQENEMVRVSVEDNGVGIAPEHHEQIFRLFRRLHGDSFPGTGIGLAIVQKGIERMDGRLGLESAPGQGSLFWFELPKG